MAPSAPLRLRPSPSRARVSRPGTGPFSRISPPSRLVAPRSPRAPGSRYPLEALRPPGERPARASHALADRHDGGGAAAYDDATRARLAHVKREAARELSQGAITEAEYAELMRDVRAQEQRLKGGGG
jgi:hypothetical protein